MANPAAHTAVAGQDGQVFPFRLPNLARAFDGEAEIDVVPVASIRRVDGAAGQVAFELSGRGARFAADALWTRREGPVERWDVEMQVTLVADAAAADAGLVVAVRLGFDD